eukprot:11602619-Karenia_brevis.AAC.1
MTTGAALTSNASHGHLPQQPASPLHSDSSLDGRRRRRLGKVRMQKKIEELKAELAIQTSLLKTLQTQCALFSDLLGEHMFGHLPTSHPSPVLFDGHESFTGAASSGHAAP